MIKSDISIELLSILPIVDKTVFLFHFLVTIEFFFLHWLVHQRSSFLRFVYTNFIDNDG